MPKGLQDSQPFVWQKYQNQLAAEVGQILRQLDDATAAADQPAGAIAPPDPEPAGDLSDRPGSPTANRDAA